MSSDKRAFRLRKLNDAEVYGPMNQDELKQLIDSAYVSPEDEITVGDDEDWKPVTEFPELGMIWKIQANDGTLYGPTSLGTIREFVRTGEIRFDDKVVRHDDKEAKTVAEVLGEETVATLKAEIEAAQTLSADGQLENAFETAREIRIRNLEADMETLQREFDELKQKYLKACEALAKSH
ncbi:MAG: DUF4339 domain-containing protein [Verrucomicrobiales bacterium]|jgi:hypothetical protein|nr:DUF4339 domain-containing protein [Verrucomicrobiales bacterium]